MQKRRVCNCQNNNRPNRKSAKNISKNHSHMFIIQLALKKSSIYAHKNANHNSITEDAIQKGVEEIISYSPW